MREIILSKLSSKKIENLLEYLENEWSQKVKNDFIKKLESSLDQIRKYPESTIESNKKKGLHKCVVTKQISIFYKYDETTIKVVTIFDNRMDPKKLIDEL
ncbi:MAG: type II toxin-antitoxin system RelE/ParE family toxin [Saprospiraceae bacterium]